MAASKQVKPSPPKPASKPRWWLWTIPTGAAILIGIAAVTFLFLALNGMIPGIDILPTPVTVNTATVNTATVPASGNMEGMTQEATREFVPTLPAVPTQAATSTSFQDLQELNRFGKGKPDSAAISPDGSLLAVASALGIYLYDTETMEEMQYIDVGNWVFTVAFSPDGETIAAGVGWQEAFVQVFQVSSGETLHILKGHDSMVTEVAFSPDGEVLASGSWDETVRLWRVSDGELLHTLEGHKSGVYCIAFSPDGEMLASGSSDEIVRFWRVSDGTYLSELENSYFHQINQLAFSPNGEMLAIGESSSVWLWDVVEKKFFRELETVGDKWYIYVNDLAYSPNGSILTAGFSDGDVALWDASTGSLIRILKGHAGAVYHVAVLPGSKILISGSQDGTVRYWTVEDGKLPAHV